MQGKDQLSACAKGMFLLVRFHIEYLCQQTSPKQILMALDKIEASSAGIKPLSPTYDRVIQEINRQGTDATNLAMRVFYWLMGARALLTVEDLQIAVSVEPGRYELDKLDLPDKPTLLEVCCGLVTIDEDTNIARFAHYTVQEYLEENSIAIHTKPNIGVVCCTYLSFDKFYDIEVWDFDCDDMDEEIEMGKALVESHPLIVYAATHIRHHLKDCDEYESEESLLKLIQSSNRMIPVVTFIHAFFGGDDADYYLRYPYDLGHLVSGLHLACSYGHKLVAQKLFDNEYHVSAKGSTDNTPLHHAAKFDHKALVQFLLKKAADINAVDLEGKQPFIGQLKVNLIRGRLFQYLLMVALI